MGRAVSRATTIPVLLARTSGDSGRLLDTARPKMWLLSGNHAGLVRIRLDAGAHARRLLHAPPRMVLAWILTLAGGAGLAQLVGHRRVDAAARLKGGRWAASRIEAALTAVALASPSSSCLAPALTAPIDSGFAGYREAGEWLAAKTAPGEHVIDPKGLALFYANETGYTFARLTDGAHDPNVRWLVAHEAFLHGPWDYCKLLRELVGDRRPTQTFPRQRHSGDFAGLRFRPWEARRSDGSRSRGRIILPTVSLPRSPIEVVAADGDLDLDSKEKPRAAISVMVTRGSRHRSNRPVPWLRN